MTESKLHPSIVALVSLAANIASNHPKQGLCQLERLRGFGIAEDQINTVVDIARHIRDEAGEMLDHRFDEQSVLVANASPSEPSPLIEVTVPLASCCTPTAKGNSCC